MNRYLKYTLPTLGIALVSGSVSWAVVRATLRRTTLSDSPCTAMLQDHPSSENNYGFLQSDCELTSSRTVSNAPDLAPAAEPVVQTVVHIKVRGEQTIDYVDPFGFFFGGGRDFSRPQSRTVTSFGSGVITSIDGYIIANNHVIEGAKSISVSLNDGRSSDAKFIDSNPSVDITLLKVDAKGLPTIPLGDSDKIKLGERVLAVGNPFNLTDAVTAGIISARARNTAVEGPQGNAQIGRFMQTDATVNRGNSGGTLIDAQGRLVGINTMIFSGTSNYSGYPFAVLINTVAKIISNLKKCSSAQRAVPGIIGGTVNKEVKKEKGLKVSQGVYVNESSEVSAAYAVGIERGDVIVAINSNKITGIGKLQGRIGRYRPDDTIVVTVDRRGTKRDFKVKLKNDEGGTDVVRKNSSSLLEAALRRVSNDQLRKQDVSYDLEVTEVDNGEFQSAGIKKGFIIFSINNGPVCTVSAARKLVETAQKTRLGDKVVLVKGFYPGDSMKYCATGLS